MEFNSIEEAKNLIRDGIWLGPVGGELEALDYLVDKAEAFDQAWACYQDLGKIWHESMCRVEELERKASIEADGEWEQGYLSGIRGSIKALNENE